MLLLNCVCHTAYPGKTLGNYICEWFLVLKQVCGAAWNCHNSTATEVNKSSPGLTISVDMVQEPPRPWLVVLIHSIVPPSCY